jgi:hypothetical protein
VVDGVLRFAVFMQQVVVVLKALLLKGLLGGCFTLIGFPERANESGRLDVDWYPSSSFHVSPFIADDIMILTNLSLDTSFLPWYCYSHHHHRICLQKKV